MALQNSLLLTPQGAKQPLPPPTWPPPTSSGSGGPWTGGSQTHPGHVQLRVALLRDVGQVGGDQRW